MGGNSDVDMERQHEEPGPGDAEMNAEVAELREKGFPVPDGRRPVVAVERLDLAALWRAMPEGDRDRIGELALGIIVGGTIAAYAEWTAPVASRAGAAHSDRCYEELCNGGNPEAVDAALRGPSWRLPASIGPICLRCGCSEHDGCTEGCGWTGEGQTLCTACADPVLDDGPF